MTRRHMAHVLFLVLVAAPLPARATDPATTSALLFPETPTWRVVGTGSPLSSARLTALRSELESASRASALAKGQLAGSDCSCVERAIAAENPPAFRTIDIDEDGVEDIIYAGSVQCAEGDATVVWFGVRSHYEVRQPVVRPLLALRFAPHAEMVASVGTGCSGDMIDRYFLGTFRNFRQLSEVPLAQETVLPTTSLPAPKPYAAIGELKLRTAPRVSERA
jgi:hypothetical protein